MRPVFFDALHACAQYVHDEKQWGGAVEVPWAGGADDMPDFKSVAAAAGQPVDFQEIIHPAAFGNILTPGDFGEDQFSLAARTAHQKIVPSVAAAVQKNFLDGLMARRESANAFDQKSLVEKNVGRQRLIKIFNEASSAAVNIALAIYKVKKNNFRPEGFLHKNTLYGMGYDCNIDNITRYTWGVFLTAGLKPVIGYLRGTQWYTMERYANLQFGKLDRLTAQLPEMPEKSCCRISLAQRARLSGWNMPHIFMQRSGMAINPTAILKRG